MPGKAYPGPSRIGLGEGGPSGEMEPHPDRPFTEALCRERCNQPAEPDCPGFREHWEGPDDLPRLSSPARHPAGTTAGRPSQNEESVLRREWGFLNPGHFSPAVSRRSSVSAFDTVSPPPRCCLSASRSSRTSRSAHVLGPTANAQYTRQGETNLAMIVRTMNAKREMLMARISNVERPKQISRSSVGPEPWQARIREKCQPPRQPQSVSELSWEDPE